MGDAEDAELFSDIVEAVRPLLSAEEAVMVAAMIGDWVKWDNGKSVVVQSPYLISYLPPAKDARLSDYLK